MKESLNTARPLNGISRSLFHDNRLKLIIAIALFCSWKALAKYENGSRQFQSIFSRGAVPEFD
jgi:hypothetical protein